MKHFSYLLLIVNLLLTFSKTTAQNNSINELKSQIYSIFSNSYQQNPYKTLCQLRQFSRVVKNSVLEKDLQEMLFWRLAYLNMSVGNLDSVSHYIKIIKGLKRQPDKSKFIDELTKDTLFAQNAFDWIEKQADTTRAIFISEAHHIPEHRRFTLQLLESLYQKGFRYLAIEMLSNQDTLLNDRGYLLDKNIPYANENNLGELVRKAHQIGFKLIPYEEDYGDADSSFVNYGINISNEQESRSWTQAAHLYQRIFKIDPQAKAIVHGGYANLREKELSYWKPTGYYFKILTEIEPLTIDQSLQADIDEQDYRRIYTFYTQQKKNFNAPILLINQNNQPALPYSLLGQVDAIIFHAKDSKTESKKSKRIILPKINTLQFPCLLQISNVNDLPNALPLKQLEIKSISDYSSIKMIINKGIYRFRLIDQDGKIKIENILKVR